MNTTQNTDKKEICRRCGLLLDEGWHCSEAMIVGVGQLLLPVHPQVLKASNGFRGGIGSTKEELCGALSGGIMVLSLLNGRTDAKTNDDRNQVLCVEFLRRFREEFGYTKCCELRENWVGKPGQEHCVQLVEKAADILLELLGE